MTITDPVPYANPGEDRQAIEAFVRAAGVQIEYVSLIGMGDVPGAEADDCSHHDLETMTIWVADEDEEDHADAEAAFNMSLLDAFANLVSDVQDQDQATTAYGFGTGWNDVGAEARRQASDGAQLNLEAVGRAVLLAAAQNQLAAEYHQEEQDRESEFASGMGIEPELTAFEPVPTPARQLLWWAHACLPVQQPTAIDPQ